MNINSEQFPKEVLRAIFDHFGTGREPIEVIELRYPSDSCAQEAIDGPKKWKSILAISLVSKRFRELCLERIFGTIILRRMKKIGQLWKLMERNPRLATFTHSCRVEYLIDLLDRGSYPFEAMTNAFSSRVDSIKEKVEAANRRIARRRREREDGTFNRHDPEASGSEESEAESEISENYESEIFVLNRDYATVGPDGTGFDDLIKSPEDLEEALKVIFTGLNRLRSLCWDSNYIPIFTSTIKAIESHGSLESFQLRLAACDEDHKTGSSMSSPSPPIWLLAPPLRSLTIWNLPYNMNHNSERNDRQLRAAVKLIQSCSKLESFFFVGNMGREKETETGEQSHLLTESHFLKQVLPHLASCPSIKDVWNSSFNHSSIPTDRVFAALQRIHSEKFLQPLEKQDVLELGKQAMNVGTEPQLQFFGKFLVDDRVAEEIVRIWNERYKSGV